jgi:Phosphotransferase enzyme family
VILHTWDRGNLSLPSEVLSALFYIALPSQSNSVGNAPYHLYLSDHYTCILSPFTGDCGLLGQFSASRPVHAHSFVVAAPELNGKITSHSVPIVLYAPANFLHSNADCSYRATMLQLLDLADATDAEIILRCHSSPNLLSEPTCSNKVVQISPDLVVKFGHYIRRGEFLNQKVALELLDPSIVRVPVPHRFIQDGSTGYLVMDFAKGEIPSAKQALAMAPQLGRILSHLHEVQGEMLGSLGGDAVQGVLWSSEDLVFPDRKSLEDWLTIRLRRPECRISFEDQPLVMCHMDFVPRNMVVEDGTVTLLDWSMSGYFPRLFDYITCKFSPRDTWFFEALEPCLETLTYQEKNTAKDVVHALQNCWIYKL